MEKLDIVPLLHIAIHLSDAELADFCRVNKKLKNFCSPDNIILWQQRLNKYLGPYYAKMNEGYVPDVMNKYREMYNMNWRDYYLTTMTQLDRYFIIGDIDEVNKEKRVDIDKLIKIMKDEEFYVYDKTLYDNIFVDENIYRNLKDEEKRWVSPSVMVYHILIGNIKDPLLIDEILNNKRMNLYVVDVIANGILYMENDSPDVSSLLIIKNYVDKIISRPIPNSIVKTKQERKYFQDVSKDLLKKIITKKFVGEKTRFMNIFNKYF